MLDPLYLPVAMDIRQMLGILLLDEATKYLELIFFVWSKPTSSVLR